MKDIARRFAENPLLSPADLKASSDGLEITCLLNPGVFQYQGKIWLIVRVAGKAGATGKPAFISDTNGNGYHRNY